MPGTLLIGFRNANGTYSVVSAANPLPVTGGGGGGGSTSVTATAAAPTYVEGSSTNPLSVDLAGGLRVTGKVVMVRTNGTPVDPDEPAEVVGLGAKVAATPTTTNGAYAAGDIIGGKLTFANMARVSGGGGWLQAVTVGVKAAVTPALELWLFDADPTNTTVADNAIWSLNATDLGKAFAVVSIAAGDWKDGGTPNVASIEYLRKYTLGATSMYGYLVDRTGTTLTSTTDIVVTLQAALD